MHVEWSCKAVYKSVFKPIALKMKQILLFISINYTELLKNTDRSVFWN